MVLFSRFHSGTVVAGLNILPHAGIKMTKGEKNDHFKLNIQTPPQLKMFLKEYCESPFQGDFKNDITIEFLCRNDGEIRC